MRRGRPLSITWEETADELYTRYRQEKNPHRRDRLQVLWLVRVGKTLAEASQWGVFLTARSNAGSTGIVGMD